MGNPSGSRAEAAYARAMTAFQQGSLDTAKRLVTEALADDPHHPGARALRTRIEARLSSGGYSGSSRLPMGRGNVPEATSVDPTILIDRAAGRAPDYVEPTVMIQRDEPRRSPERQPDPFTPPPSRSSRSGPAPEPTILIPPKKKSGSPSTGSSSRASSPSFLQLLWLRVTGGGGDASPSRRSSSGRGGGRQAGAGVSSSARGVLLVVAGLVVAAVFVFGLVALIRWIWAPGNVLTIAKPSGGTVVGAGLSCGTRGEDCAITRPADQTVELQAVADSGYVFSGFTGDCAPAGRVLMSQPRSCGATFGRVTDGGGAAAVTWPLTITKPTGGTIVEGSGIICGTLDSICTKNIPDGAAVTLTYEADKEFHFVGFTGECGASGEVTMNGPKTCGATFAPGAIVNREAPREVSPPLRPTPRNPPAKSPVQVGSQPAAPQPLPPQTPTLAPPTVAPSTPTAVVPPVVTDQKPPPPPETEEDHAKKEIAQLVKNYCAELETLQPARVHKIFPTVDQRTLREQFRQYKSLKCTLAGPPEYDRIDVKGAGGAQLKVGMKQTIATQSGGAPQTVETIVTIIVSRIDNRSAWTIDRVKHEPKPK